MEGLAADLPALLRIRRQGSQSLEDPPSQRAVKGNVFKVVIFVVLWFEVAVSDPNNSVTNHQCAAAASDCVSHPGGGHTKDCLGVGFGHSGFGFDRCSITGWVILLILQNRIIRGRCRPFL